MSGYSTPVFGPRYNIDNVARAINSGDPIMSQPGGLDLLPQLPGLPALISDTPFTNGGTLTISPGADPGWTKYIPFMPGNPLGPLLGNPGAQGDPGQPPGSTYPPTPGATPAAPVNTGSKTLNYVQELAIRALMILVGVVLVGGGLYVAGARSARATTIVQLARAPFK